MSKSATKVVVTLRGGPWGQRSDSPARKGFQRVAHLVHFISAITTLSGGLWTAVVRRDGEGEGSEISVRSGIELIRGGLESWKKWGMGCQRILGAD